MSGTPTTVDRARVAMEADETVTVAVVGFGELGSALGMALAAAGGFRVRAWSRPRADGAGQARLLRRIAQAGNEAAASLPEAVAGARVVLLAVPARAAAEVAEECLGSLTPGSILVDLSAAAPQSKQGGAAHAAEKGVLYVDGAVLGTVMVSGAAVPIVAAGTGAADFTALVSAAGLSVRVMEGAAGQASRVKLLRSVYLKGRDGLVLEMLLAARRLGLEGEVVASIAGPGERVTFDALVDRILTGLAVHAGRRADELEDSAAELRAVDVEPLMTAAATRRLRRLAELGLRERFGAQRPGEAAAVLDAIAELAPEAGW